eukprot:15468247-Alexandrium_andersonii.AAC.1
MYRNLGVPDQHRLRLGTDTRKDIDTEFLAHKIRHRDTHRDPVINRERKTSHNDLTPFRPTTGRSLQSR